MTEDAFLDALRLDPLDDVTRLVYADWLEERGDGRADFLRAEFAGEEAMRDAADSDADWAFQAGRRWDVVLGHYPLPRKFAVIKAIRNLRYIGLPPAKVLSDRTSPVVLPGVPAGLALAALDRLRAVEGATASLRPADAASAFPPVRAAPYHPTFEAQLFVRLMTVRPDRVMSAARAVAEASNARPFEALDGCLGPLPLTVAHTHPGDEAAELLSRFDGVATVELFHAPHGSPEAEWVDLLRPQGLRGRDVDAALIRMRGYAHDLRRVPRFHGEELVARLSAVGPFTLRRSEDQP